MTLVVWKKRDASLYYRLVKNTYANYYVGFKNQYDHEVIFIVENLYQINPYVSLKKRYKNPIKRFLYRLF